MRRTSLVIALVLVVLATGFAGWFGWSWYSAAHDDSLAFARTREDVRRIGEAGVITFRTIDYHSVDEGLNRLQDASTGPLLDEIVKNRASYKTTLEQAKNVTTAKVIDAAVTELDTRAGKATLIAEAEMTATPEGGKPGTKAERMQVELTRTDAGWKLSSIAEVPAVTS